MNDSFPKLPDLPPLPPRVSLSSHHPVTKPKEPSITEQNTTPLATENKSSSVTKDLRPPVEDTSNRTKVASITPSFGNNDSRFSFGTKMTPRLAISLIALAVASIALVFGIISNQPISPSLTEPEPVITLPPVVAIPTEQPTTEPFPTKEMSIIISEAEEDVAATVEAVQELFSRIPGATNVWGDSSQSTSITAQRGGATEITDLYSSNPSTIIVVSGTADYWTVVASNRFIPGSISYDSGVGEIVNTMR